MNSWIVTVPKKTDWNEYMREVKACEDGKTLLNYRVSFKPNIKPGDRLYVTYNGAIRGWMEVCSIKHWKVGFTCTTSGQVWKPGWYVQRTGQWHPTRPTPFGGFRGYRKLTDLPRDLEC